MKIPGRRQCLICAIVVTVLGLAWQLSLVYGLYGGNWSALFYHGDGGASVPAADPAFAGTYLFPNQFGFDGQYYRVIAHDPFLTHGYDRYVNQPTARYRRILVPLMAYALAFGQPRYIDAGYMAVMLLFLFLGVYWLGRYATTFGRSPNWGWAFLLVPGTLAGLERGSIDTVLTVLTIGFVLYLRESDRNRLLLVLILAALCRETGMVLLLACAGSALLQRRWRWFAWTSVCALPALAWYGFVRLRNPPNPPLGLLKAPLSDLLQNLFHHDVGYIKSGASLVQLLYYLSVLGILLAFVLAVRVSYGRWTSAEALALLGFTAIGLTVQPAGMWTEAYHFGRVLAPLLLLLALQYFPTRDWRRALPAALVSPAILLVSAASALRLAKHLL